MYLAIKSTLWKAGPAAVVTLPWHSTRGSLGVLTAFSEWVREGLSQLLPLALLSFQTLSWDKDIWALSMDMEHFCTLQEIACPSWQ